MQKKGLRVIHYLNQFFGGIGGEDKADIGPRIKEGPLGPGRMALQSLGEKGDIIATVICGDNAFAQDLETVTDEIIALIRPYQPDALIAGPAFFAGRYAMACGSVCKAVRKRLGIPAVTGMYRENPAVEIYSRDVTILETGTTAKGMPEVLPKMVDVVTRLVAGEDIGSPSEEGYFPRGILVNRTTDRSAAQRAVSMLLAKVAGQPFKTEVPLPAYDPVPPAPGLKDLKGATIALVTDGGLTPKGNPDRIEPERSTRYGSYPIKGMESLNPEQYEVNHAGYTPVFVNQDPHRLLPLDVMRDLEKEGAIGKLHNTFFSTSGCASIMDNVKKMGKGIAGELKARGVGGAILTST